MELKTESVSLTDDLNIVVCEADAGYDARLNVAMQDSEKAEGDPLFVFFCKTFYPLLYACTKSMAPSAEDAFALPPEKLDEWYGAIWRLNPDLLGKYMEPKEKTVKFRDGSTLKIRESQDYPSYLLRLVRLEMEAQNHEKEAADEEISFRNYVYPKIAACVVGEAPAVDDVIENYPHSEISKWSSVAMDLNKNWFSFLFDAADKLAEAEADKSKKKKGSRRTHNKKVGSTTKGSK